MTQNIYDDPEFFAGYSRLGRSVHGLDGAGEWPALRAMLPDISGQGVVDLGCGFGWFCRWAREKGAANVSPASTWSEKMLTRARAETTDPAIRYVRADLERFDLPAASFNLAYSSLVLHYIEDLDRLLTTVHDALIAGGHWVLSVEHLIYTAPIEPRLGDGRGGAAKTWPVDGYLYRGGPRDTDWLTKGVIKQHRTIAALPQRAAPARILRFRMWRNGVRTSAQIAASGPEWADELSTAAVPAGERATARLTAPNGTTVMSPAVTTSTWIRPATTA